MRREYQINQIKVNGITIEKVIIDEHVDKHSDHINDALILKIIGKLDEQEFIPTRLANDFQYFMTNLKYDQHWYKLVWLLEDQCFYVGVITLFRDRRIK